MFSREQLDFLVTKGFDDCPFLGPESQDWADKRSEKILIRIIGRSARSFGLKIFVLPSGEKIVSKEYSSLQEAFEDSVSEMEKLK